MISPEKRDTIDNIIEECELELSIVPNGLDADKVETFKVYHTHPETGNIHKARECIGQLISNLNQSDEVVVEKGIEMRDIVNGNTEFSFVFSFK